MTKFLMKCFFVTTVLLFGMVLGIQIASNNLVLMTGDKSYSIEQFLKTEKSGEISAYTENPTEANKELTSHDLEGKQEKLEQIETFNLFSQMGSSLSDVMEVIFTNLLSKITTMIGEILT